MPNLAPITGSMVMDPSAYITGLNQAASATARFQQGVGTVTFAGFNRGMIATTTLLYSLNRLISSMSQGMEEFSNMLGRIGTVADLTATSVQTLAESMRSLSVAQGVSRKDLMGGMYTAAQSGFDTPREMRMMARSGALLSRASGKEINVKKSVDLLAGTRQALGIGQGAVTSNRMTDILLRARDIGRWELDQMAEAIGKVSAVYGNQFRDTLGGEETLRQIAAIMSVVSLTNLPLGMVATGTRRLAERTFQLRNSKRGEPLRAALRGIGYTGDDPVMSAFNKGPISYLQDVLKMTGGTSEGLYELGYMSRELNALAGALRGKGANLQTAYQQLSYGNVAGTTDRYNQKMLQTYDARRDQLRAQWEITSQEFMKASLPLINQFVSVLEKLNQVAQSLPDSVKSFVLLISAVSALRFALNLVGFRTHPGAAGAAFGGKGGGKGGGMAGMAGMAGVGNGMPMRMPTFGVPASMSAADVQSARLSRRMANAATRPATYYLAPQYSGTWNASTAISDSPSPGSTLGGMSWRATAPAYGAVERLRTQAIGEHYAPYSGVSTLTGYVPGHRRGFGATTEQRIRWEAYKRGQSVDFANGSVGTLNPRVSAYFSGRGKGVGTTSASVWHRMQNELRDINGRAYGPGAPISSSSWRSPQYDQTVPFRSSVRAAVSSTANGIGGAVSALGGFTRSLYSAVAPMLKFALVVSAVSKFAEGLTYKGKREPTWDNGQRVLPDGGGGPGVFERAGESVSMGGAWLNGSKFYDDWIEERARKYGMVPGESGFRKANANDAFRLATSEMISPELRANLVRTGKDMGDYGSVKDIVDEHIKGLGFKSPKSWGKWIENTEDGLDKAAEMIADALKAAAAKIKESADKATGEILYNTKGEAYGIVMGKKGFGYNKYSRDGKVFAMRHGGHYAPVAGGKGLQRYDEVGTTGANWNFERPWMAGTPHYATEALVRQQILSGRQWDIYQGTDPTGRNGNLNWNAGGRDYRAMYNQSIDELGQNFGGFAAPSYSANSRRVIDSQRSSAAELWKKKAAAVGAKFGGFSDEQGIAEMLWTGDQQYARNKNLQAFLKVMPDIGTMPKEEAMQWFGKLTGRSPTSDAYADVNFRNFRGMDLSQFVSTEQTGGPVQYAQATQFGSAEAYNELLQRDKPEERMVVAFDKLTAFIDNLTVKQEDVEKVFADLAKGAKTFFEKAESTDFFNNIQNMADSEGND